jgi:hypothetical protein
VRYGESDLGAQRREHTVCASVCRTCSEQRAWEIGATSGKGPPLHTRAKTRVNERVEWCMHPDMRKSPRRPSTQSKGTKNCWLS